MINYLEKWIEQFTDTASGLEIERCDKLYLNEAKYKPIKESSCIELPKVISLKRAIIDIKNNDERCLEWILSSAVYPDESGKHPNMTPRYKKHFGKINFKEIDFLMPIYRIPKVEKQNDFAINVYICTVSEKQKFVNTSPYYIFEQTKNYESHKSIVNKGIL